MLDSESMVTLGKDKGLFTKITDFKQKVWMKTNTGAKSIKKDVGKDMGRHILCRLP